MIDFNAFIGAYPWRHIPHPDAEVLVRVLAREGFTGAWVGHLPSAWHRDPADGNAALLQQLAPHAGVLSPVPVIRPDWPDWEASLVSLHRAGAVAIRAYPQLWGLAPGDSRLARLAEACRTRGMPLVFTARFEDVRQRHPLDGAPDLTAAQVRELARAGTGARLLVTAAGREMIEETHWGLTPAERERVYWDFSWIWGPPVDDLSHLVRTIGADRFVRGTMWPLRLTQLVRANEALLEPDVTAPVFAAVEDLVRT